ncbi:MAG TPA: phosphatase PAP2 family protein, partial [Roseiflexaceae bacterium]
MGSIVCYGMLAYIGIRLVRSRLGKLALALAATLTVLGVGLSRVYFGVHYPTDIAGGYLAGAVWLAIAIGVVEAAERQARRRQHVSVPETTLEQ